MKQIICLAAVLWLLTGSGRAAELPRELEEALPREAGEVLEGVERSPQEGIIQGLSRLWERMREQMGETLHLRIRNAAAVLLVVVLCGAVEGISQDLDRRTSPFLTMAGALSITLLTAGSLNTLIGLGAETIGELAVFSRVLLPTLATATAAAGAVTAASLQQVVTVAVVDLLVHLVHELLMPLMYLYIGTVTAAAMLPEHRLGAVAELLKKIVTWVLTTVLLGFTLYLSVVRILSAPADGAAVKMAKAAISGAIPVVGGIISEAAETVLAGAGMLQSTIGVVGTLGILAACAHPFLQLGIQYLVYKGAAFLSATVGPPGLCRLIDALAGAFGLVLGMTGACGLLLLIAVLTSVSAVLP